jgi:hypothetical protein
MVFGWDKEKVDRQPSQYLKLVVSKSKERVDGILGGLIKR